MLWNTRLRVRYRRSVKDEWSLYTLIQLSNRTLYTTILTKNGESLDCERCVNVVDWLTASKISPIDCKVYMKSISI